MLRLMEIREQSLPFTAISQCNKMRNKVIFFILLLIVITLFFVVQQNKKKSQSLFTSAAPIIIPEKIETSNIMDSPEGSMTLTLDRKENLYSLFVETKSDEKKIQIFKKVEDSPNEIEIPYNTWSPDNIYVFLKEKNLTVDDYLVFQSSGALFSNGLSYVSIQDLFKINVPNYTIEDVTGWAAPNLLIVNTKANESDQKVSFWFDVPSQSFIQLGTYFK